MSKLVAQFSGAVRGLSTEGTVQWQCNPGENSVTLGGVSVSVGFAFSVDKDHFFQAVGYFGAF